MYSPQIKPEKVKALYQLKLKTGKKLTKLVDEALESYLKDQHRSYVGEAQKGGVKT